MQHFIIVERAHDVEHAIHGLNVGKEGITKAFALGCTLDEACYVCDLEVGFVVLVVLFLRGNGVWQ